MALLAIWRPTISAIAPPRGCSSARSARSPRWRAWSDIADTSSTGTTRARSRRCTPRYVSTVDSGNLAAHLLVLGQRLAELRRGPRVCRRAPSDGLRDTLRVLLDVARGADGPLVDADVLRKIERQIEDLDARRLRRSTLPMRCSRGWPHVAAELTAAAGSDDELAWWARAYQRSCYDHQTDLVHLAAWLTLPAPPAGHWQSIAEQHRRATAQLAAHLDTAPTLARCGGSAAHCAAADRIGAAASICRGERLARAVDRGAGRRGRAGRRADPRVRAKLARQCRELADMDFGFLYNSTRDLFAIGYNVSERRLDASFYDLLASEARLASFMVDCAGSTSARSIGSRWAGCSPARAAPALI